MTLYGNKTDNASFGQVIDFSMLNSRTPLKRENEKNGNNNNYNNNYPGARVCAREGITGEMDEMREIYALYCDAFGRDRVAAIVRREIAAAIEAGAEPSLIAYAIEVAEAAPTPSWSYARAVIRKCMADKCRTYEDCEARAERMYTRRSERRGQDYAQRDIDSDADSIFNRFLERGHNHGND